MTAASLAGLLRGGDMLMWSQGAAEPVDLVQEALAHLPALGDLAAFLAGSYSRLIGPDADPRLRIHGMGAVGSNRLLCDAGRMQVHPVHLSHLPTLLDTGIIPVSVVMLHCGPAVAGVPGPGVVHPFARYALRSARVKIAQISSAAPRTRTRHPIDLSGFDAVIDTDRAPITVPQALPQPLDLRIADHAAALIRDGDTLQIGIGTLPSALLAALHGHRHLGLHTGVMGDAALPLIASGAIDNSRKRHEPGLSVVGALAGSDALYRFADGNPALLLEPIHVTHGLAGLAAEPAFVAVNSAIAVDLTGQVASEVAGGRYLGTIGGQVDFIRAALASPEGRSLICLPSRTGKGSPRIVARLTDPVTVPRADADHVVTEWGSASLRGQPVRERARRMIAIAHPDDRDALSRAARDLPG